MTKYWYYYTVYHCPQCGKNKHIKSRRMSPKPASYVARHAFIEAYDGCDEDFLVTI